MAPHAPIADVTIGLSPIEGPRNRFGGRWSSRGVPMVYCSSSLALAAIELFVHIEPNLQPFNSLRAAAAAPGSLSSATTRAPRWSRIAGP